RSNSLYLQYHHIIFFQSSTKSHPLIPHLHNTQIQFYANLKQLTQLHHPFFTSHNTFLINPTNIQSIHSKHPILYFKNKEHSYASLHNLKNI
ncbi:LytTR family transcriptional regulator DNA-binding domain-containing protein, partial [Staphylococcus warneri]|uniref:LytTR family transcriptional regulator DNA-binding domain-containing protein n=1 Tax=Staphylococcus warneri TaxID=1292 RepID=UPI00119E30D4